MMRTLPRLSGSLISRATPSSVISLDPAPLEQFRQEGRDVAFLEEPDRHATERGEQVEPERRAMGLDGAGGVNRG